MILQDTQSHFTPDAHKITEDVYCGVCGKLTEVERNCYGATSLMEGWGKHQHAYDEFTCPDRAFLWHRQVAVLRREARQSKSGKIRKIILDEAEEILETKVATIDSLEYPEGL